MSQPRIVITAGEPAGIGPDVVLRALQSELAAKIAVITDINVLQDRADLLGISCYIDHLEKPEDVLPHTPGRVQVLHTPCAQDVVPGTLNATNAPHVISTLTMAAELTLDGLYDAVVTAPVQKSIINDSGIPFSGHTEFFADFFDCDDVVMLLANQQFKVALATTHLPLRDVADAISRDSLCTQLAIISRSLSRLYGIPKPKIAMLGLNPHAGEGGYLGREEIDELIPACESAREEGIDVSLPLPADTAFVSKEVQAADVILAMYHDQGLPVLKTAGFGDSVNITLGLPIIRTSVDHGTALTLAGSGEASEGSLLAAINEAIICSQHRT
jgi:4-hydroxythreonine-4-phosphate dehydrogenase